MIEAERERDTDEDEIIWKVNKKYSYSIYRCKEEKKGKQMTIIKSTWYKEKRHRREIMIEIEGERLEGEGERIEGVVESIWKGWEKV